MTQDEIIEMAKQAGFDEHHAKFDTRIKAFYKLATAAEREACAALADVWVKAYPHPSKLIANGIRARGKA